jgi:hypothetical protein
MKQSLSNYSTKKLIQIVNVEYSAYSSSFIDQAKDELILRGEEFSYNPDFSLEISNLKDEELINIVNVEFENYKLEYQELARKEFLKRGFKFNDELLVKEEKVENEYFKTENNIVIYFGFIWALYYLYFIYQMLTNNVDVNGIAGFIFEGLYKFVTIVFFYSTLRYFNKKINAK